MPDTLAPAPGTAVTDPLPMASHPEAALLDAEKLPVAAPPNAAHSSICCAHVASSPVRCTLSPAP